MCNLDFKSCKGACGIVGIVVLVFALAWVGVDIRNKINESPEAVNMITVSGTGEIFVAPDLAQTSFSVITEAKTVGEALKQNTEKMNAVVNFVKGQGVESKDLKTTSFNIFPRYEYQAIERDIYPYPPGKRVLVGYEVSQSLQVKIRDLTKVGAVLEGAAGAGANLIGDLQFTVDKEEELKKEARAKAIVDAKEKAAGLTSQLGVRLVRIVNFNESGGGIPIFFAKEAALPMAGGATSQIETGENKIQVQVSITYEIR
ncbi:MAG: SIMPL domain-containing protein [Candidatus Nealsonbacteria bacterium]|nr:SIMPL domain-containing protein [Candidatus Nealsonbacteria bacterium]